MRWARFWARVRRRLGIIAVRSPQCWAGGSAWGGRAPVGRDRLGNSSRLPGVGRYGCPDGEVRITVPSGTSVTPAPEGLDQVMTSSLRKTLHRALARREFQHMNTAGDVHVVGGVHSQSRVVSEIIERQSSPTVRSRWQLVHPIVAAEDVNSAGGIHR